MCTHTLHNVVDNVSVSISDSNDYPNIYEVTFTHYANDTQHVIEQQESESFSTYKEARARFLEYAAQELDAVLQDAH